MEMRKFIIELHSDGSVTAQEFEEPADQAFKTYQAGALDAVDTVISILAARKAKCRELAYQYRNAGNHDAWEQAILSETVTEACIETIKTTYHLS